MDDEFHLLDTTFKKIAYVIRKRNIFEEIRMPAPQAFLLMWIYDNPGSGIVDISRGLRVAPPTITVGLHGLAAKGLVHRERSEKDRRAKVVVLTKKGQEYATKLANIRIDYMNELLSSLSENEQEIFFQIVEKIYTHIVEIEEKFTGDKNE